MNRTAVLILTCMVAICGPAAAQKPQFIRAPTDTGQTPFSEAVRVGNVLYLSGMIGVRPGTTTVVEGGIAAETRQTLQNIRTALERAGGSMDDVVKCLVMLTDIGEWGRMNEAYVPFFPKHRPARSTVGVAELVLNARIEIECIAVLEK